MPLPRASTARSATSASEHIGSPAWATHAGRSSPGERTTTRFVPTVPSGASPLRSSRDGAAGRFPVPWSDRWLAVPLLAAPPSPLRGRRAEELPASTSTGFTPRLGHETFGPDGGGRSVVPYMLFGRLPPWDMVARNARCGLGA